MGNVTSLYGSDAAPASHVDQRLLNGIYVGKMSAPTITADSPDVEGDVSRTSKRCVGALHTTPEALPLTHCLLGRRLAAARTTVDGGW